MRNLLVLLIGVVFLCVVATPAWAPLVNKVEKPNPPPKNGGDSHVVDLSDKKSQVPKIPPTPAPKQEKQSPKK
jgi:hypothetical protein